MAQSVSAASSPLRLLPEVKLGRQCCGAVTARNDPIRKWAIQFAVTHKTGLSRDSLNLLDGSAGRLPMRRRKFITLLGSAAVWPLVVRAEQSVMPVIGFLHVAFPERYAEQLSAFRQGLKQGGYVEGQNLSVEYRGGSKQKDRTPE